MSWQEAYNTKARKDRWGNFTVLRHGAFDGMLVTSKNSGTHWVKYMLAVALAETYGIEPPRYFSEDAVRPYIGWTKDQPVHPSLPRLAFSHTIPHRLMDWAWARKLAGLPPYVLLMRHPMSILASHFAKWEWDIKVDWPTYLEGEPSGKQFRCDIYWIARFWNRWGEVVEKASDEMLVIHYEDVLQAPRETLEAIGRHWSLKLTPAALDLAVRSGTKEAMAEKIDPAAEPNVLQKRAERLEDQFSGRALELYAARLPLFRHTLGYDLARIPGQIS